MSYSYIVMESFVNPTHTSRGVHAVFTSKAKADSYLCRYVAECKKDESVEWSFVSRSGYGLTYTVRDGMGMEVFYNIEKVQNNYTAGV